jgi:hypothetical protein
LEETNKGSHLKDDPTVALLITISPHTVTMFNEIDNIPRFNTILNGEPIGLGNHANPQHGINIRENSNRRDSKL